MSFFNSGSYISSTPYHTRYRNRLKMILALIVVAAIIFNVFLIKTIVVKVKTNSDIRNTYKTAVKNYETGCENYDTELIEQAYNGFEEVQDYKDSKKYMDKITEEKAKIAEYDLAMESYKTGDYANAYIGFHSLGNYRDSENNIKLMSDSLYSSGKSKMDNKEYEEARKLLLMIPDYSSNYENAQELLASIDEKQKSDMLEKNYQEAVEKFNAEDYAEAQSLFIKIRDYSNSEDYIDQIGNHYYTAAQDAYDNKDYNGCLDALGYIDSESEWKSYNDALSLKESFKTDYKGYVEETAKQKLDEEGYASFKEFVNGSVNEFYSKNEAESLLKNYEPVYLSDMTSYDEGEWESAPSLADWGFSNTSLSFENNLYDEEGGCHQNCMVGGGCYITYHLGDGTKYRTLNGVLFVIKDHQATKDNPVFLLVRDGEGKDLYRGELYSGYGNESFSVDVSGVEDITLYFDGLNGGVWENDQFGAIGELCLMP